MNKIQIDGKYFVELKEVKKILKWGLDPSKDFSKNDSEELKALSLKIYNDIMNDIEALLK